MVFQRGEGDTGTLFSVSIDTYMLLIFQPILFVSLILFLRLRCHHCLRPREIDLYLFPPPFWYPWPRPLLCLHAYFHNWVHHKVLRDHFMPPSDVHLQPFQPCLPHILPRGTWRGGGGGGLLPTAVVAPTTLFYGHTDGHHVLESPQSPAYMGCNYPFLWSK